MAAFAVLFGVRSVNANEPHRGLMLAVADRIGGQARRGAPRRRRRRLLHLRLARRARPPRSRADPDLGGCSASTPLDPVWWATCVLAALAFLCLPRQFHVAVVENTHVDDVRTAAWAFPLYLVAINLFVLPVAVVGLALFPDGGVQPDTFMVAIPRELGWPALAFVAFLGGLSAATGMIIVATLALGTMVSNDVILPLLARHAGLRARWEANPGPALLAARRVAVVGIMALAYLCYLVVGPAFPLAAIGLISFAAVAQFAPALLGGMFWRRGHRRRRDRRDRRRLPRLGLDRRGAGLRRRRLAAARPAGRRPVRHRLAQPASPSAASRSTRMLHGLLWSLGPNLALFVAVSLATEPSAGRAPPGRALRRRRRRRRRAASRRRAPPRSPTCTSSPPATSAASAPTPPSALAGAATARTRACTPAKSDAEAVQATERLLAGAIGSASARVVVAEPALRPPLLALRRPRADRRGERARSSASTS